MRKLGVLRGIAILAVVIGHAVSHGMLALVGEDSTPHYASWVGTPIYYSSISLQQLSLFSVPAFFFASGLAITYMRRSNTPTLPWGTITQQVKMLFTPFVIWIAISVAPHLTAGVLLHASDGNSSLPAFLLHRVYDYYYIVVLCEFVLMSPILIPIAKRFPRRALLLAAIGQIGYTVLMYVAVISPGSVDWLHIALWSPLIPLPSIFYYVLGVVAGCHSKAFNQRLFALRLPITLAVLVFGVLSIAETVIVRRVEQQYATAMAWPISTVLYSIAVIVALMAIELPRGRVGAVLDQLGIQSYGIYLLQAIVFSGADKLVFRYSAVPQQLFLQPLLIAAGLGLPLSIMAAVSKSPFRRYYFRAFGVHPPRQKPAALPIRVVEDQSVSVPSGLAESALGRRPT